MCESLGVKHAMRMRCITLPSVACPAVSLFYVVHTPSLSLTYIPYLFTLLHKLNDLREKNIIEHKMSFDFLYNFARNISRSKNDSARYDHKRTHIGLHVKYPLFLSCFNETCIF